MNEPIKAEQIKESVIRITKDDAKTFSDALSDINCWLSGFYAAGGTYSPGSLGALRELKIKIDSTL